MAQLLENVSVDTTGAAINCDGGSKTIAVWATSFGGGTVSLEGSPDGTVWIPLTYNGVAITFTANSIEFINRLGQGMRIRARLTGSTGASNVNVDIFQ